MRATIFACLLLLTASATRAQSVDEIELPDSPDGFSWSILSEIKAAFLMPEGWYLLKEGNSDTQAFFLTKEDISQGGIFKTGISINVVFDVKEKIGATAPEYAQAHAYAAAQVPGSKLIDSKVFQQGPFHSFVLRYESTMESKIAIIHQINVGNEDTDTLYIMMFEAPSSEWEDAWKIGEVMMELYFLDLSV